MIHAPLAPLRRRPRRPRERSLDAAQLLSEPGRRLPLEVQKENGARFGHDFSQVRVHDSAIAAAAADALTARAFTIGSHIFFGSKEHDFSSEGGRRLLRHELAHAAQQSEASIPDGGSVAVDASTDAERAARSAAAGTQPPTKLRSVGKVALVQCDDASQPQPQPDKPRSRSIAAVIGLLNRARELSLGTPPQDDRALTILDDVYRYLSAFVYGDAIDKALKGHGGMNLTYARVIIGEAVGGVHHLASFIRSAGHPSSGTWDFDVRKVEVAREYLEVVAENITASESALVAAVDEAADWTLEATRVVVELTPVIGSLIMLGEAVVGTSITGKALSRAERAVLGFGALLAEVGPILRAGRTAVAAARVSEVAGMSRPAALRMCFGARTLLESERDLLANIAAKVRAGTALTARETVLLQRLLGKIAEADRTIAVRAALSETTGEAAKAGRFTNLATAAAASPKAAAEIAAGQVLARELSADVVRMAEDAAAQGAKNPDFLINNTLAEFVELETTAAARSPVDSALTKIVSKHLQAGIVVVDLTKSAVTSPELIGSANRLWGNPRFLDVAKLIVMRAGHVIAVIERPTGVLEPLVSAGTRGAANVGSHGVAPAQ